MKLPTIAALALLVASVASFFLGAYSHSERYSLGGDHWHLLLLDNQTGKSWRYSNGVWRNVDKVDSDEQYVQWQTKQAVTSAPVLQSPSTPSASAWNELMGQTSQAGNKYPH